MRQDVGEAKGRQQVRERPLNGRDRRGIAGDRIGAQNHVAHGIGPAVEHLPLDVADVVGRRIGLNASAQIALRSDLTAGQRVEDLLADRDQLFITKEFDYAADRVAGESRHQRADGFFRPCEQELLEL